jgi:polysaccharide biosynthesis/export protein
LSLPLQQLKSEEFRYRPVNYRGQLDTSYVLGAGDRVLVEVFESPEYSGEKQILADGSLSLPLVGSVPVQGMSLEAASGAISERYAPFLRRPIVTLSVITPRPIRVVLSGEIDRPGAYTMATEATTTEQQLPTLSEALQLAGGITLAAELDAVQIRRTLGTGRAQTVTLNLWDLTQSGDLSRITLRDGDSIFIPTSETLDLNETRQLASANLFNTDSKPLNVAVVGEVLRPGTYTLTEDRPDGATEDVPTIHTVSSAIQTAGGITEMANVRQIQVRRFTSDGGERVVDVDLWALLQEGDLNQDLVLQEGDTIVIPTATSITAAEATELATATFSPATIQVYVVGEVTTPGAVEVPPNTPLNQAILAAGGFDAQRANRKEVALIRLNQDGTVNRREISIDLAEGISDETNPILRNNDVIAVGRSGLASFSDSATLLTDPIGRFLNLFNIFNLLR